jgi:Spy/CpxP family protein refolding chaperone
MKRFLTIAAFLFCLFIIYGTAALAQDPPGPPPFGGPGATKFEQFKKMRIIEALRLDDETAIRFVTKYNKFTEEMREFGKQRNEISERLEEALRNKAGDEAVDKIIKEFIQHEGKSEELRNKFYQGLREILTTKQIAQYIVFEKNFNQNIRDVMREMTQDRDRREP